MTEKKKPGRPKSDDGKKSQGTDRHSQPRFAFHLEPELLAALGDYCEAQKLKPDRSEVVRLSLREYLEREGFWPAKGDQDDQDDQARDDSAKPGRKVTRRK